MAGYPAKSVSGTLPAEFTADDAVADLADDEDEQSPEQHDPASEQQGKRHLVQHSRKKK